MLTISISSKRHSPIIVIISQTGLLGIAFGFLGSFYVQSSCHFVTANVSVGDSGQRFDLYYGMWKYTPMGSVFQGYSYCYKYDDQFTDDTPIYARIVGLLALLTGALSLAILWVYLVLGRATQEYWTMAIYFSVAAGIFQALTLLFFVSSVCERNQCTIGPGAAVSIVSTITWFLLAFELHYNTPIPPQLPATDSGDHDGIVASLEMSDVKHSMKAFLGRVNGPQRLPTLNQFQRDRETKQSSLGSYAPPHFEHA